jgi:hypothetical protein
MSLALEVTVGHIVLLLSNPMKQTKYDLEIEKMHVLPILLTQVYSKVESTNLLLWPGRSQEF